MTPAEDFSFFAQKVPGLFFFTGGMPKGHDPMTTAPHQSPEFIIDDNAFKIGVIAFCNLAFDYAEMSKNLRLESH